MNKSLNEPVVAGALPDLDCAEHIDLFVDRFYARVLVDPLLKPIFIDIAQIDLAKHLPLIKSYWRKLLLGERGYQRHTMNIHRAVNVRQRFTSDAFERWLALFTRTVREGFAGPQAERAVAVAGHIARNMEASLQDSAP